MLPLKAHLTPVLCSSESHGWIFFLYFWLKRPFLLFYDLLQLEAWCINMILDYSICFCAVNWLGLFLLAGLNWSVFASLFYWADCFICWFYDVICLSFWIDWFYFIVVSCPKQVRKGSIQISWVNECMHACIYFEPFKNGCYPHWVLAQDAPIRWILYYWMLYYQCPITNFHNWVVLSKQENSIVNDFCSTTIV